MQIDFRSRNTNAPAESMVQGSVVLVDGRAVAVGGYVTQFLAETVVVQPGDPSRRLTLEDGVVFMRALPFNFNGSYSWAQWNLDGFDDDALVASFARLRRAPASSTVEGSLPVLFFGDFLLARAVTVALNPSNQEYVAPDGSMLTGQRQRFAAVGTYVRESREKLTDVECSDAISWMRSYFAVGRPSYKYFSNLARFLDGAGYSYGGGSAAHLDLVQESTRVLWRGIPTDEREELLAEDLPFLEMQLRSRPLDAIFCNGRFVSDTLKARFDVTELERGTEARLNWWTGRLRLPERDVPIAGWNYPLDKPTGLNGDGERALGRFLAGKLESQSAARAGAG